MTTSTTSTMTRAEAEQLLRGLTMTNLRAREIRTGIEWSGTLCIEGLPVLFARDAGRGGPVTFEPVMRGARDGSRALQERIAAACVAVGLDAFEPLGLLSCALEPGITGLDAVAIALDSRS